MGYGSTTWTATFPSNVTLPNGGTIPAGTYSSQGDMFTYLFGPVVKIPIPKVTPFGELLFGGSNTNGYTNLFKSINAGKGPFPQRAPSTRSPWRWGGGVDISLSKRVSIRPIEADYMPSRYSNPLTSTGNQNNFRYNAGIVLKS